MSLAYKISKSRIFTQKGHKNKEKEKYSEWKKD